MATNKYTIVIEEGVPFPKRKAPNSFTRHPLSYLLPKLEVGDSFLWPVANQKLFNGLRSAATYYGNKLNRKFATRTVAKGRELRLRFWRLA